MRLSKIFALLIGLAMAVAVSTAPALAYGTQVAATPEPTASPTLVDPKTGLDYTWTIPSLSPSPSPTPQPLTPEGNMQLVDDIPSGGEDKQFLVVQSRGGNYFYIIVDRTAETNSVHFLNQVDEEDLLSIIKEDAEATPAPAVCTCVDLCQPGEVDAACPVCALRLADCQGVAPATPTPAPTSEPDIPPEHSSGQNHSLLILGILALLGGGTLAWFKFIKPKTVKPSPNPDDEDEALEQALNKPAQSSESKDDLDEDASLPDDVVDELAQAFPFSLPEEDEE